MVLPLLCFAFAAQAQKTTADNIAASGSFDGQLYSNKLLGFTMLAPGGWRFYTPDQNNAAVTNNRERAWAAGESSLVDSAANTQVLFQATLLPITGPDKTALFSCGIERLNTPRTSEKYLEANKELVLRTPGVRVTRNTYAVTFGGANFAGFDVEGAVKGAKYRQRYIATVRRNVALFFVVTLYDNKQDQIVEYSLNSIRFGKR